MQRIELDNFRVFGLPAGFDLAPVTVLTGKNNSGKSSLIKAFLVLADYLEQDDQTVLRLDGPRASQHRISDWRSLKNWDTENDIATEDDFGPREVLTLGYTTQSIEFSYQFDYAREVDGDARLRQLKINIHNIGELVLTREADNYKLSVAQKFINYVVGSAIEREKLSSNSSYEQSIVELRNEIADLEQQVKTLGEAAKGYALRKQRSLMERLKGRLAAIHNISMLARQGNSGSGILFHAKTSIALTMGSKLSIATLIQQALINYLNPDSDSIEEADELPAVYDSGDMDEDELEGLQILRELEVEDAKKQNNRSPGPAIKSEDAHLLVVRFHQALERLFRLSIVHLGANRMYQARVYLLGGGNSEIQAIADAYENLEIAGHFGGEFLENWMSRFEIGETVRINRIENAAIRITVHRAGKKVNLADLGFGAGQVLTILMQLAALIQQHYEKTEAGIEDDVIPLILIEESEANLHPQMQSLMAELFTEVAHKYPFRFILETHSEYLIRNIQVLVKEQQAKDLFKIYYFDTPSEANGDRHGHEMRLREDGVFMDEFGEGFLMNESAKLTFKLF